MDNQTALISPHVFIFPLPLQGPVNSMLKLAEILCLNNIKVTFLNTQYIQQRLSECTNTEKYFEKYPNFSFQTVPDGLSEDNPRSVYQFSDLVESLEAVAVPVFQQMLTSGPRVTCLIVDSIYSFAMDIAQEIQVPLLLFDTISPCTVWIYLCLPKLIQAGELPFKDDSLDKFAMNATAMEGIIQFRDLPSFCRKNSIINNSDLQLALNEVKHIPQSQGLILNTFQELDGPVLSQLRNICPNVYAIGPVHAHLKTRLAGPGPEVQHTISSCIWKEDRSCISWLNKQPSKSVIYVSIGSLAVMTKDQLFEIWHGLVNSGSRFLWVRRPGSVVGLDSEPDQDPLELIRGTKERGCIVSWAPQEEVLAHPAVGGIFHSQWVELDSGEYCRRETYDLLAFSC